MAKSSFFARKQAFDVFKHKVRTWMQEASIQDMKAELMRLQPNLDLSNMTLMDVMEVLIVAEASKIVTGNNDMTLVVVKGNDVTRKG